MAWVIWQRGSFATATLNHATELERGSRLHGRHNDNILTHILFHITIMPNGD